MSTFVNEIPVYNAIMIYLSALGGLIGITICIILIMNILLNINRIVYRTRVSTQKVKSRKPLTNRKLFVYILYILFLSFTILSCTAYTFIRCNVMTQIDINHFTRYQCMIGFFIGYGFGFISRIFLYIVFIHRIKTTFNASAYDYHPSIYKISFIWCTLTMILFMSARFWLFILDNEFVLDYNKKTGIIFCASPLPSTYKYFIYLAPFWEFFTNIILLYMFTKGLYSLHQSIMTSHFASKLNVLAMDTNINIKNEQNAAFRQILEEYERGNEPISSSMKMMINLHKLMKKQTLLIMSSIISSMVYWMMAALVDASTILITWDLIVNAISVWLMLASSNKYWIWCTKYGFCCCCYNTKTNNSTNQQQIIKIPPTAKLAKSESCDNDIDNQDVV